MKNNILLNKLKAVKKLFKLPFVTYKNLESQFKEIQISKPIRKYASLTEDQLCSQLYGVDNDIEVTQVDKTGSKTNKG